MIKRVSHFVGHYYLLYLYRLHTLICSRKRQCRFLHKFPTLQFDKAFYVACYPEVRAYWGAYYHFVRHGYPEGRAGVACHERPGAIAFNPQKETVLLVSHEASRTGAPILTFNIAAMLNKTFNVMTLTLNGGELLPFLAEKSTVLFEAHTRDGQLLAPVLNYILTHHRPQRCIVNSIEAACIVQPFAQQFVPTLLLIHEFYSYIMPSDRMVNALCWASKTVFSSRLTQANAMQNHMMREAVRHSEVIPQGKSEVPRVGETQSPTLEALVSQIRQSASFLVVGVGTIAYRKGVDLFIQMALELRALEPASTIKLLWVGDTHSAEKSFAASVFDQIARYQLQDSVQVIPAVEHLELLYQAADVLFLSSRLDPLPNVAIDMMMLGKPVLCFEQATGMVEFLAQDSETAFCVIPHMSVYEATKRVVQLSQSATHYERLSQKMRALAKTHFDMPPYVAKLIALMEDTVKLSEQEKSSCQYLESTEAFNTPFFAASLMTRSAAIRFYVRSWCSQVEPLRKPAPGFNPGVYQVAHAAVIEPFSDYLQAGKPVGPWQDKVLIPTQQPSPEKSHLSCALHIHVFFPELLPPLLQRIVGNTVRPDLFISTSEACLPAVEKLLAEMKGYTYTLRVVPNRGRDIGPFLTAFSQDLQQYEIVGHVHTKKSALLTDAEFVNTWVTHVGEHVLGGRYPMIDYIATQFQQDAQLGLVFPEDPHVLGWGDNKEHADQVVTQLGLAVLPAFPLNFPVGMMFWARPQALKCLFDRDWQWEHYPEEPVPYDGTVLHALERLLPFVVQHHGFTQAVTYIPGVNR